MDTERHYSIIAAKHPDVLDISGSDDFLGWVERQPPKTRRVVQSGTAEEVIEVLDEYKAAVGLTRQKPSFTRQQIKNMPMEEFQRREAEIDAAVKAGAIS